MLLVHGGEAAADAVFLCRNDPGRCDGSDAASSGDRALLFTDPL